jgi:hypothetical protein
MMRKIKFTLSHSIIWRGCRGLSGFNSPSLHEFIIKDLRIEAKRVRV